MQKDRWLVSKTISFSTRSLGVNLYMYSIIPLLVIALFGISSVYAEDFGHLSLKSTTTLDGISITGGLGGDSSVGTSLVNVGDIDGDGVDDFAVGAGGLARTSSPGNVHILFMEDNNIVREVVSISANTPNGPSILNPGERFGDSMTNIGDIDGDGISELVVGAPGSVSGPAGPGKLFVLYLNSDGTLKRTSVIDGNTPNGPPLKPGDRLGYALENLGDFDGNGTNDLLVGAPGDVSPDVESTGDVYIILLNNDGTVLRTISLDGDDIRPTPSGYHDWFAVSLANIGDLDNDGVTDIAVGASRDSIVSRTSGAFFILFMNSDGTIKDQVKIDANTPNTPDIGPSYDMGETLDGIGDFDGDGIPDLAVGAPGDFGFINSGYAYIILLNSDGTIKNSITINDDPNFPSLESVTHFGWFITSLGDLDGDDIIELGITSADSDSIYIVSMNGDGTVKDTSIIIGLEIGILSPNSDHFGEALANIGDLDGDGNDELAVGVLGNTDNSQNTGKLIILFLNDDGTTKDIVEINANTPNGPILVGSDRFGDSVSGIGDIDNDGVTDIAVGAPGHVFGGFTTGDLHILFMNSDGTVKESVEINGETTSDLVLFPSDRFGQSVTNLGDLNNDGVNDIAVGAPGHALEDAPTVSGKAFVLFLNNDGTVKRVVNINDTLDESLLDNGDRFGWAMSSIGDVNNGIVKLAIGAPGHFVAGISSGDLFILDLDSDGVVQSVSEINAHTPNGPLLGAGDRFGESITDAGDINRDGVEDIAVGASGHTIGVADVGDVFVLFMNEDGTVRFTEEITVDTPNGPILTSGDRFGRSVANIGDLDSDGHPELAIGAPAVPEVHVVFTSTDTSHFITTWEVTDRDKKIRIPVGNATGSYTVEWGDGNIKHYHGEDATHEYENAGVYTVRIYGDFTRIVMGYSPLDAVKLHSIEQWGSIHWATMEKAFEGTVNMVYNATDTPNLTDVNDMSLMFFRAEKFDGDLSSWDVSNVTDMSLMFTYATAFNGNISNWDVSSVTDMSLMLSGAERFNQPLNDWDVSLVTDMRRMFAHATIFNQPLDKWDVSNVNNAHRMFSHADQFNQNINSWDVSSMTDMNRMFNSALRFNQPLDNWNVSNVTDMSYMFLNTSLFNQPIGSWDVSSVTNMKSMFAHASSFNQPLNSWNVGSVTDMSDMFSVTPFFNQPLDKWDVSNVTDMHAMFSHSGFAQSINSWDVSNVTNMHAMFHDATDFNQPLDNWDVSNVTNMSAMFSHASTFNQPLEWGDKVSNVDNMHRMFHHASAFDQPVNDWDVSSVKDTSSMFRFAYSFNQPLDNWDVSNVEDMHAMFLGAAEFNQELNGWKVDNVTNMHSMFSHADSFNMPLDNWNVSNVTNMYNMFLDTDSFVQELNEWDVSSVTNMRGMFADTREFNQPLDNWNVSNVTDMSSMFKNNDYFNQDISNWNVSSVEDMSSMFTGTVTFNQPLNSWNVSNVSDMSSMFENTRQFNQPLNSWNVSNVSDMSSMFAGSLAFNQSLGDWNVSPLTDTKSIFDDARALTQENVWPYTIDIVTFIDTNENGIMDDSEDTLSNVQIIVHVPSTSMIDVLVTNHNGIASKEYSMPTPFYVITTPPSGYTVTTQVDELDPGVFYIADPMLNTIHQLEIGLK